MFWTQQDQQPSRQSLPRQIALRRGTMDDEYATFEVMRRTMGHEMAWSHHAAARRHLQNTECASFWLAVEKQRFSGSKVVGYARSVVREGVWSLTEFFVLPGHHRQGIGGALLARCQEDGKNFGADTRIILASQHSAADSLYVRKLVCFPRLPMMMLVGSLAKLRSPERTESPIIETTLAFADPEMHRVSTSVQGEIIRAEPMVQSPEVSEAIDALDRRIVGYARPQEHAFWAHEMGGVAGPSRIFRRAQRSADGAEELGEIVGYAYMGPHSSGPALADCPADLPHMIAHVARLSGISSNADSDLDLVQYPEQYLALAGTNEVILKWLLECGWHIVFHYLFMTSRPIGSLDRYVGYNPLYFL